MFVGSVPLLKRSGVLGKDRWEPHNCEQISKQLSSEFGLPVDLSSKAGGLKAICNALNESDVARAQIATVLLGIPDPPLLTKSAAHTESETIRFIRDLHWSGLLKVDWDPDEHPRWPAGSPDSQGGQFAPKGGGAEMFAPSDVDLFDAPARDRQIRGYTQIAQVEPEPDEFAPEIGGQTEAESRAAVEIDSEAGEARLKEQGAEEAGEDTKETYQSQIDRQTFARQRADFWKNEAVCDPLQRQLPPEIYTDSNLALMRRGLAPIGSDGYPIELHHPSGLPWEPLVPMTRTDHRLGPNYLLNHPWLYGKMMTDIFVNKANSDGTFAGVLEIDNNVGYFYLYKTGDDENEGQILGAVQVHRGAPNFILSDAEIRWFDEGSKVGLFVKGELRAYFDLVSGKGYPVVSRTVG